MSAPATPRRAFSCISTPQILTAFSLVYSLTAFLTAALRDPKFDPITRHEAGEAIAAIGDKASLPLLREFCDDACAEVAETCRLAVDGMEWKIKQAEGGDDAAAAAAASLGDNAYGSEDPAPAHDDESASVGDLQAILVDTSISLFKRYRAMFSLRNLNTPPAVDALAAGFADSSVGGGACSYDAFLFSRFFLAFFAM
jgi:deoxyhypusine monooxygenase